MKILSIILLLLFTVSIHAATITVTRNDDRNSICNSGVDCSLREAVKRANTNFDDDTILFASNVTFITLNGSQMTIEVDGTLAIIGNGANVLTVSGNNASRIFRVNFATATISNMTLTGGNGFAGENAPSTDFGGAGGAILGNGGTLTMDGVHNKFPRGRAARY